MGPSGTTNLSQHERRRALSLSLVEAVLFAVMLGAGETYFLAKAVALGATPYELGLVNGVPLLFGALGTVLALALLRLVPRRRAIVALSALVQGVTLFGLAGAAAGDVLTPLLLIALMSAYYAGGQAAGMAWSSWYGDLVPASMRGRYFARRTRLVQGATFLAMLGAGLVLEALQPAADGAAASGFVLVFGVAGLFRVASAVVLARSPEPRFSGLPRPGQALRFLYTGRGRNAWRVLLGSGLFHLGAFLAGPFFVPYMLDELRLGYAGYTVALGGQVAAKVVSMTFWGRVVDRRGSRSAFRLSLLLSATIPLPWLWIDGLGGAVLAHAWSGIAWGGFEIALFAMLLDSTVRRTRPLVFTAHNLANGTGQILGSMGGAAVVSAAGYAALFAASLAARVVVALGLPPFLRELRSVTAARPRRLALRVVGQRAGPGLMHRPVLDAGPRKRRARPAAADDAAGTAP